MKFFVFLCCVFAAAPCAIFASAAVGVDNGPIAFALLDKCKQRFKCEVRKLHRIFSASTSLRTHDPRKPRAQCQCHVIS